MRVGVGVFDVMHVCGVLGSSDFGSDIVGCRGVVQLVGLVLGSSW